MTTDGPRSMYKKSRTLALFVRRSVTNALLLVVFSRAFSRDIAGGLGQLSPEKKGWPFLLMLDGPRIAMGA